MEEKHRGADGQYNFFVSSSRRLKLICDKNINLSSSVLVCHICMGIATYVGGYVMTSFGTIMRKILFLPSNSVVGETTVHPTQ